MTVSVRLFSPSDQTEIAEICYQTGYMGEPMLGHFQDLALFALLFAQPYLVYAPGNCWVAVIDAKVVGYCLSVDDTRSYQHWHRKIHRRSILRHIAKSTLWRSPKDILQILRWDTSPKLKIAPAVFDSYPAHFHINVLAKYQHRGIGRLLITTAFEQLQTRQTQGIHLRTTSRNTSALNFYKQLGFSTLATGDSTMWRVPGVQAILMAKSL